MKITLKNPYLKKKYYSHISNVLQGEDKEKRKGRYVINVIEYNINPITCTCNKLH